MEFRIADTFTDSLGRLTGDEQKAVKTTAFDLQLNPASPGLSFHKLDRAKDKNFWSVRVSRDIRLIVHRSESSLLLCYVDHHDKAYDWAERRRLETHPTTGAAQLVEIRELVKEIVVPVYVPAQAAEAPAPSARKPLPALFDGMSDEELLAYGVPSDWLSDARAATEDTLLGLADHLPAEAAEALLQLATGGKPRPPAKAAAASPLDHPDAQRRFRVMRDVEELERALAFPWDKWTVFLHPDQKEVVEASYAGPARVAGSAGTGKTIVALHRAVYLARTHDESRVLLTTLSDALASALHVRLRRLVGNQPRLADRIDVHAIEDVAFRLYKVHCGPLKLAARPDVVEILTQASGLVDSQKFSLSFLLSEWEHVVDAWQIKDWEGYRDVVRLGRKTRLAESQRQSLWAVFERVRSMLEARGFMTPSSALTALAEALAIRDRRPYDFAVVDEAQDLSVAQIRFLAALGSQRPDTLFFAGDLGQRIYQQPFSWKSLGVDIRGRARHLRLNYRTSHQIRSQADRLLNREFADVDGNADNRADTISVFNGPTPTITTLATNDEEVATVAGWLSERAAAGVAPHEIGVFVRSTAQLDRAKGAVEAAKVPFKVIDDHAAAPTGYASVGTMHLAKGLEFRGVVVMACDDEVIPLQERVESVGDDADLQEVYDTERHLLYVACTRARDDLLVTGVAPASEFLDDLKG